MKNMLKAELKKAFRNRYFYITLLAASLIAVSASVVRIVKYYTSLSIVNKYAFAEDGAMIKNPAYATMTAYNGWLGGDMGEFLSVLFYFLLFFFATLPFSWSLASEMKSGYISSAIVRGGRRNYYCSKYVAAFLSGAVSVTVPMILNFVITLCFIPARLPDIRESLYMRGVDQRFVGGDLFYSTPFLYVFLYIGIAFLFAGLWATVPLSLAFLSRNRFIVIISPYLFLIFFHFLASILSAWRLYVETSMIAFVMPSMLSNPNHVGVMALWAAAIIAFAGINLTWKGFGKDVL